MGNYLKIINIPKFINVLVLKFKTYNYIFVFGIFGFLKCKLKNSTLVDSKYGQIKIVGKNPSEYLTYLKIVYNLFFSVVKGYTKFLELRGLGFKYKIKNNILFLVLGYSHITKYKIPSNLNVALVTNKLLKLYTNNKLLLDRVAFELKSYKPINIYKGKGIFFKEESVILKVGKKPSTF